MKPEQKKDIQAFAFTTAKILAGSTLLFSGVRGSRAPSYHETNVGDVPITLSIEDADIAINPNKISISPSANGDTQNNDNFNSSEFPIRNAEKFYTSIEEQRKMDDEARIAEEERFFKETRMQAEFAELARIQELPNQDIAKKIATPTQLTESVTVTIQESSSGCPDDVNSALGWAGCAISYCESQWNPNATGSAGERGLFQIHPIHPDSTYDRKGNIASAIRISNGGQNWGAWTTNSVLSTGVCSNGLGAVPQ